MDNDKYTRSVEILFEMAHLSVPEKLPVEFYPFCKIIWKAFNLGRKYEKLISDSSEKVCDVCGSKWISDGYNKP